jgi:hypothetical protein
VTEQPAEPPKKRRRIVKWTVRTVAGLVLFVTYIAGWCWYDWGRQLLTGPGLQSPILNDLFAPLNAYAASTLPVSDDLYTLNYWAKCRGTEPWTHCESMMHFYKHKILPPEWRGTPAPSTEASSTPRVE